jgi:hypothetical protein
METSSLSTRFMRLENFIEPLRRRPLESDIQSVKRLLTNRSRAGWQVVGVCDDELHVSNLIYKRIENLLVKPTYAIGEIPIDKSIGDVTSIVKFFGLCLQSDFVPVCVIENPAVKPIAIVRKSTHPCTDSTVKAFPVSLRAFGSKTESLKNQLFDMQMNHGMSLACIIHGGLNPVLIGISHEHDEPLDYHVDQAFGGFYRNQTTTLEDLIQSRSEEGWHVCATFLDVMEWPCVVFKRETKTTPAVPIQSA